MRSRKNFRHTFILSENGDNTTYEQDEIIVNLSKYEEDICQLLLEYSKKDNEHPWRLILKNYPAETEEELIKVLQVQKQLDTDPARLSARLTGSYLHGNAKEFKEAHRLLQKLPKDQRHKLEAELWESLWFFGAVVKYANSSTEDPKLPL